MPAESRFSYGTWVNRRSEGTPPAFTIAPAWHYQRRPGLNWGIAVALSGSDAGIARVSAAGVTVYPGAAGFLLGSTWALPMTTRALPGLHWDKPKLVRV
ncbi:hypothetical protein DPMN_021256 [Dreissena polymorpha]|uniref:Uncharacterized protein n=1 Tax=Dreissena polymorpha TaxID=45954 RepID=A0A9D4NNW4_DREPO|nr:hypothetical protein DPMN_021256 [Dreissena polymorpha]